MERAQSPESHSLGCNHSSDCKLVFGFPLFVQIEKGRGMSDYREGLCGNRNCRHSIYDHENFGNRACAVTTFDSYCQCNGFVPFRKGRTMGLPIDIEPDLFENLFCMKCSFQKVTLKYVYAFSNPTTTCNCGYAVEHFHASCERCGYQWTEKFRGNVERES